MRTTILVLFTTLVCLSTECLGQSIPKPVRTILDNRFHDWRIIKYSLPSGCIEDQSGKLNTGAKSFYRCNLNNDSIPDYALRIVTGRDSNLVEYFLAIVSNIKSSDLFVVDSCRAFQGAGHRYLWIYRSGEEITMFGGEGSPEILAYAQKTKHAETVAFPVDAIQLEPICESYYKAVEISTYVFIRGKFYEFSSGD